MSRIKMGVFLFLIVFFCLTPFFSNEYFITSSISRLKPGYRGESIKEVQQRLKNWGYYKGSIDGYYGWDTFAAIRKFQQYYDLYDSGIAGEDTLIAMGLSDTVQAGTAYARGRGQKASNEQLLARAIDGEARGEPYKGQVAVGAVILNRTRSSKFPKTIAGVIYQPGAFTAVSDGQINVPLDPKSTVVKAARDALNGWDPTNGCLYYWNPATATSKWIWSRKIIARIGKHNFGI